MFHALPILYLFCSPHNALYINTLQSIKYNIYSFLDCFTHIYSFVNICIFIRKIY